MVIEPIRRLYTKEGDKLTANKNRRELVKNNITNCNYLRKTFDKLKISLEGGKLDIVMDILTNELFYEILHKDLIVYLHKSYIEAPNKNVFIEELIKSYKIRGYKGAVFAWIPLLK